MLRELWEWLRFLAGLLLLGVWIVVSNLVLLMLTPFPGTSGLARRVIGFSARTYFGVLSALDVLHLETAELRSLRREDGVILISNHPSLMDAMLFVSQLPQVVCVMKASINSSPLWMIGARIAGYISTRNSHQLIDDSCDALRAGSKLLIFPEGTRTRTAPVNEFKGGFGLIARKSLAPVRTVILETNSPFLQKGWPIWKKPRLPLRYGFRLGQAFRSTTETRARDFVREVEEYYRQELGTLSGSDRS